MRAEGDISDLRYEVMYLLDAEDTKMHAFREVWSGIGDSIVIIGGDGLYNCHIHTDDIGASIEAALDAGRPREIRITDLTEQIIEERWVREASAEPETAFALEAAPATSIVAVVVGEGVGRIFRTLGVRVLVKGGQTMNPSTADLVDAVRATGSDQVVILPNNKNIRPVAEQVDALVEPDGARRGDELDRRGLRRAPGLRPRRLRRAQRRVDGRVGEQRRRRRGDPSGARHHHRRRRGPSRRLDRTRREAAYARSPTRSRWRATSCSPNSSRPEHELSTIIEGDGSTPANTRRITEYLAEDSPSSVSRCTTAANPSTPITSASSE